MPYVHHKIATCSTAMPTASYLNTCQNTILAQWYNKKLQEVWLSLCKNHTVKKRHSIHHISLPKREMVKKINWGWKCKFTFQNEEE